MSQTQQTVERQTWSQFNRLLQAVLPVRGTNQLLGRLADGWRELTAADAAFISALSADGIQLIGSLSRRNQLARSVSLRFDEFTHWSGAAAMQALGPQRSQLDSSVEIISFRDQSRVVGGAILFCDPRQPIDTSIVRELSHLSARLIEQAFLWEEIQAVANNLEGEKLEALAELAAGAGHEINNPVASISGRVQLLLQTETNPVKQQALKSIGGQAYRIRDMIGDLMLFARPPKPNPESLDLAEVISEVLAPFDEDAGRRGGTFEVCAPEPISIWADRVQLAMVVSSLVQNSLNATEGCGPIQIRAESAEEQGRRLAMLTITDHGTGLCGEDRRHLFDPFYSGRHAGRGLGFGLSKCWRIVSNHGGRIHVDSVPDQQTTFTVHWPANAAKS